MGFIAKKFLDSSLFVGNFPNLELKSWNNCVEHVAKY